MDLPEDVTVDILLRLPVKSVCRIQCVSKTCLNIAGNPGFGTLHTMRLLDCDIFDLPQLMLLAQLRIRRSQVNLVVLQSFKYKGGEYVRTKTRQSDLVSKIFFQKYYDKYDVDFVFCNLFFFKERYGGPCFLVNPLGGEVLKLPISNNPVPTSYSEVDFYGMGFDNITRTYKIVHVLASEKGNYVVAQVLVLGTSSWRQIHLVPPCDVASAFLGSRSKNGIYASGGMHWLIYGASHRQTHDHMISFDFNKEQFYATLIPNSERHGYSFGVNLLNFKGSLALVNFGLYRNEHIKIWVLKNYDKNKWELYHQVKTKDLRLSSRHFLYCLVAMTCAEWEHGICFKSSKICYFLDLRHPLMKRVRLSTLASSISEASTYNMNFDIFNYTGSLISLKNYGNLIEATKSKKASVWHID